ncbi:MAG: hypothetical protein JJ902_05455 [Roseibium sp.]|nr:hypothetical protein [Roseibium sp.]
MVQSVWIILTTELGSRVERRDFGAIIPKLIDQPQNQEIVVNFIMAVAEALEPRWVNGAWYGEPRFHISRVRVDVAEPGQVAIMIVGDYFPLGHLRDYSQISPKNIVFPAHRLMERIAFESNTRVLS